MLVIGKEQVEGGAQVKVELREGTGLERMQREQAQAVQPKEEVLEGEQWGQSYQGT